MVKNRDLRILYTGRKEVIRERIGEFNGVGSESDGRVFAELCFCLLTPQSKARVCWDSVTELMDAGVLYTGSEKEIMEKIGRVRFNRSKAVWIVKAREFFTVEGSLQIKEILDKFRSNPGLREFLVKNISGLGYKEASHFLRNIGLGKDLAILDRHVLRSLHELKVIPAIPKSLSKKRYLGIEERMKRFSEETGIPLEELDLLLWYRETGDIFK